MECRLAHLGIMELNMEAINQGLGTKGGFPKYHGSIRMIFPLGHQNKNSREISCVGGEICFIMGARWNV